MLHGMSTLWYYTTPMIILLSLDSHKVTLSHTSHSYFNKDGVCGNKCPKICLSSRNSFKDQDIYYPDLCFGDGPIPLEL